MGLGFLRREEGERLPERHLCVALDFRSFLAEVGSGQPAAAQDAERGSCRHQMGLPNRMGPQQLFRAGLVEAGAWSWQLLLLVSLGLELGACVVPLENLGACVGPKEKWKNWAPVWVQCSDLSDRASANAANFVPRRVGLWHLK